MFDGGKPRPASLPASLPASQWQGWGSALKPAHEPICVARKPLIGTIAENVLTHGVGALNIDGCRVGDDVVGWGGGSGFEEWGSGLSKNQNSRPIQGRWPANVIHDGSTEATTGFPVEQGGSASRFFYCAKASQEDRDEGLDGFEFQSRPTMGNGIGGQPDQSKAAYKNTHPTVKPTDLMRYLCRLVTPPDGVVLDPFMGSGSTGKAAMLEGFRFVGIDMTEEYYNIAQARIQHAHDQRYDLVGLIKKEAKNSDQMSIFDVI